MKSPAYPFSAIVGQDEMKLALLLAAVDWRISVLLRGDKGAGKTTAARALAGLLPSPSPFVNLPIGATEDRLLGGLHLERALKGEPALKPGLLSEAHGGVLYIDEINLLAPHLGDTLLDVASSGVNVVEREGFSASHAAEFVLLGSMNPDEGSLRPQLLDRFALAVDVAVTFDPALRQSVVQRRIAFESRPSDFHSEWSQIDQQLRELVQTARNRRATITCSDEIVRRTSEIVCEAGVRSLRADLAVVRASVACAALEGDECVTEDHVSTVLPLVLAHRRNDRPRPPSLRPKPPKAEPDSPSASEPSSIDAQRDGGQSAHVFPPKNVEAIAVRAPLSDAERRGTSASVSPSRPGPVTGARRTETPNELDLRQTLTHALAETGRMVPTMTTLHERIRSPKSGTRYLVVIDSSGSHAVQQRMRLVKGIANDILSRSFKNGDEVAIIVFRGPEAQVLLEPSSVLADATTALEYLPTGGRTPLAHALELTRHYLTPETTLILLTDGRANVPLAGGDPWLEALEIARQLATRAILIDTERSSEQTGQSLELAKALGAEYLRLDNFGPDNFDLYKVVASA